MAKRWVIAETMPAEGIVGMPEISPVVLQLLWTRGVRTKEAIESFLLPDWDCDTFSSDIFLRMKEAVARTFAAVERGEKIVVHGDYDADGVCGSAVLVSTLRELKGNVSFYIPHREKEGYGFSIPTADELVGNRETKLIITVDCGISNGPAIARAKELGADTIVCDHHAMPPELPKEAILLHPQVPGEIYPNKSLCGTGVAFKFASALIHEARRRGANLPEGHEKWLLDLVAIATVTDVMPLVGENRALEKFGLKVLNKTRRLGLKKLIDVAGGKMGLLDTFAIGFQIGPRLNAAGRMRHASLALELLLAEDETEANRLAQELHETNADRRTASDAMYQEAKKMVGDPGDRRVLVVVGDGWSAGLVGLVAGKLVGDFGRPVYVIGRDGEAHVGSGRTTGGFDVTAALHAAAAHLDRFGGHPQACGFSITGGIKLTAFIAAVEAHAALVMAEMDLSPILKVDAELAPEEIGWPLVESLTQFEPVGEGNPRPLFVTRNLAVVAFDTVGKGAKHLRLTLVSQSGKMLKTIAFGFGALVKTLVPGQHADIVFELGVNEWNGSREIQLRLVDIKL